MSYRILTKNAVENTNIDGARDHNFNAGRRSGIVKGALNQGNFFVSSSNTIVLDTCELRLCGHRIVIDEAKSISFHNQPSVPIRYSLVAQIIVDNDGGVSFDLHAQTSSTALVQDNLDTNGSGTYELEIGRFTQLTDGTITDVVRTADLITGGAGGGDSEYIRIGTVTTNKISPELDADVDIENTINPDDNKPQTNFTFNLPTPSGTVVSVAGEEKTSINTDTTPTANSQNLVTSGGVFKYTNNISNPNLLINGDFRVNQRGKTSYTHTGEQYGYTYFVDRWFAWGENPFTFNVSTKTLTPNTSNTGNSLLSQWIEDVSGILGKTITYSVSTNGTIYSKTLNIPTTLSNNVSLGELPTSFGKLRVWSNNNILRFDIIVSYNHSIVLNYAKVELGNVITPFSPRPYAEELAMCQRYYQNINTISSLLYARTTDQLRAMINFKAEMRTKPTLTQLNTIRVFGNIEGTTFTQTSAGVGGGTAINKEGIMVALLGFSGLTKNNIYQLDLGVSAEPIFTADAEIY